MSDLQYPNRDVYIQRDIWILINRKFIPPPPSPKFRKANIFDNMLAIMEKYACNLEGLVQQRTNELVEEKKKTDALLNRMLPK